MNENLQPGDLVEFISSVNWPGYGIMVPKGTRALITKIYNDKIIDLEVIDLELLDFDTNNSGFNKANGNLGVSKGDVKLVPISKLHLNGQHNS